MPIVKELIYIYLFTYFTIDLSNLKFKFFNNVSEKNKIKINRTEYEINLSSHFSYLLFKYLVPTLN